MGSQRDIIFIPRHKYLRKKKRRKCKIALRFLFKYWGSFFSISFSFLFLLYYAPCTEHKGYLKLCIYFCILTVRNKVSQSQSSPFHHWSGIEFLNRGTLWGDAYSIKSSVVETPRNLLAEQLFLCSFEWKMISTTPNTGCSGSF